MTLTNRTYNLLKPIALVVLPALAVLYAALAGLWDLPDTVAVVGSISAVDTFLGAVLHLSSASYNSAQPAAPTDGSLTVDPVAGKLTINVESMADLESLVKRKTVILGVNPVSPA